MGMSPDATQPTENVVAVIPSACDDCPIQDYSVSDICRFCLGRPCLSTGALHPGWGGPHTLRVRPLLTTSISAASLAAAPPGWMPSWPRALLPSPVTLSRLGRAQFLAPLPPTPVWVTTSPYQSWVAPPSGCLNHHHCVGGSPTQHGNCQAPPALLCGESAPSPCDFTSLGLHHPVCELGLPRAPGR